MNNERETLEHPIDDSKNLSVEDFIRQEVIENAKGLTCRGFFVTNDVC